MRTVTPTLIRAKFVWLADKKAVYSYGPTYHPEFFVISEKDWEGLGKAEAIEIRAVPLGQ